MSLAPPKPVTWQAAQFPAAADFNTQIRDAFTYLTKKTVFRAYQSTVQSMPNAAITAINLQTVTEDTYAGWNSGTFTYTVQATGLYQISGCYYANGGASGIAQVYVTQGGVPAACGGSVNIPTGTGWGSTLLMTLFLVAGTDTIQLAGYQNTGAALNTFAGGINQASYLEIEWVGS
jgi:hypothetical protein